MECLRQLSSTCNVRSTRQNTLEINLFSNKFPSHSGTPVPHTEQTFREPCHEPNTIYNLFTPLVPPPSSNSDFPDLFTDQEIDGDLCTNN